MTSATPRPPRRAPFWRNGKPTPHAIDVFTEGDCWALAFEIDRVTPLEVYAVRGPGAMTGWAVHWVAGDGEKFLDITGISDKDALLEHWECPNIDLVSDDDRRMALEDLADGLFVFQQTLDRRRLRDTARRLLGIHGKGMGLS